MAAPRGRGGTERKRAFIIGAGRLGCGLAVALPRTGVDVIGAWSRSAASAARARRIINAPCKTRRLPDTISHADIVLLTVPDDALKDLCEKLVADGLIGRGQDVVHCSGCTDLSVLRAAEEAGASIGSLHPLSAFSDAENASNAFAGALAIVDGSTGIARRLAALAKGLGMRPARLAGEPEETAEHRALYHAAAVIAASGMLSTFDLALEAAEAAGLKHEDALAGLLFLSRKTLENLERKKDTSIALTGPVARGDDRVVARHERALRRVSPEAEKLYRALSRRAASMKDSHPRKKRS